MYWTTGLFASKGKNMSKLLEGKAAVMTPAAGVGLGIAQKFVEQGASVVVTGRRQATLDEVIVVLGPKSSGIVADVPEMEAPRCFSRATRQASIAGVELFANGGMAQV
jgi:short-subunit dehydrogenase involved in D-alanine esterification of teichoic acids